MLLGVLEVARVRGAGTKEFEDCGRRLRAEIFRFLTPFGMTGGGRDVRWWGRNGVGRNGVGRNGVGRNGVGRNGGWGARVKGDRGKYDGWQGRDDGLYPRSGYLGQNALIERPWG